MDFKKITFLGLLLLLIGGCSTKNYTKEESALIVWKTPTIKYADLGFIYQGAEGLKVELYSAGQAIMALEISESSVCMSMLECMSKKGFNEEVLSTYYPEAILDHIFRGEAIFDGQGLTKTRNGFTQHIEENEKYNIDYSVLNKQILFHDTINNILIKVKRLNG